MRGWGVSWYNRSFLRPLPGGDVLIQTSWRILSGPNLSWVDALAQCRLIFLQTMGCLGFPRTLPERWWCHPRLGLGILANFSSTLLIFVQHFEFEKGAREHVVWLLLYYCNVRFKNLNALLSVCLRIYQNQVISRTIKLSCHVHNTRLAMYYEIYRGTGPYGKHCPV